VRPFSDGAGGGAEWTISNGGGTEPQWRRDGKELFYFSGEVTLVAVEGNTVGGTFKADISKPLFETRIIAGDTPVPFGTPGYWPYRCGYRVQRTRREVYDSLQSNAPSPQSAFHLHSI
jgi:hypothetical protein